MPRFSFDLDALRDHLPDKLYQRGEGYAEGGRVNVIGQHGGRVVAQIDGESGRYTVEVNEADVAGLQHAVQGGLELAEIIGADPTRHSDAVDSGGHVLQFLDHDNLQ